MELCSSRRICSSSSSSSSFESTRKAASLNRLASLRSRKSRGLRVYKPQSSNPGCRCCRFSVKIASCVEFDEEWRGEVSSVSSENVVEVLRSIPDPVEALLLFKCIASQPRVVHTTASFNYMLELLRVHGRVEDMALVFDLMQKQIVKRDPETFLIIFKALGVRGGLRGAPFALSKMKDAGFVLNAFSCNGLIYFILRSGFIKEAVEVYERMVSEGIKPSLKTYSALMVALGRGGMHGR
uniref:Pentatricopeptide repeat-containing protein n=1 Tax=Ananas comosus var. bracteatus TaxID=296719 RepID=A0A6V7PK93_ANACO|nr:unnamed protein product [Ananas comosus var. bracteatus]